MIKKVSMMWAVGSMVQSKLCVCILAYIHLNNPMCTSHIWQVNYLNDDQWNLWGKLGIRKLVSIDGTTPSVKEHENIMVRQSSRPIVAGGPCEARSQYYKGLVAALEPGFPLPIHDVVATSVRDPWTAILDNESEDDGSELFTWDWRESPSHNQVASDSPVRILYI